MGWKEKKGYKMSKVDLGSMGELGAKQSGIEPAKTQVPTAQKGKKNKQWGVQEGRIRPLSPIKKLIGEA